MNNNYSNKDIDVSEIKNNVVLGSPSKKTYEQSISYFKERTAELYVHNRADVKVLAEWIVTLPAGIENPVEMKKFFEETYNFLAERYGEKNVVACNLHFDEGKRKVLTDRWTGQTVYDENNMETKVIVAGRPHMHFDFIPVVPDKNDKHMQSEKVSAKERLNRSELRAFHGDLNCYLAGKGVDAKILNGATIFGNRSVKELKRQYELEQEISRLKDIEAKYNAEHVHKEGRW